LKSLFLGMFGDPLLNNRGFTPATIEDLCELITDCLHTTPNHFDEPNSYPSIRNSELRDGYLDLSSAKYVSHAEYQLRIQRYRPSPGDTIYCREGARFGSVGIIPEGMTPCLGQRTMLFKANVKVATPEYLWAVLCSRAIFKQAENVVGGAASPHVNIKDIRKFQCALPPLELQTCFSAICKNIFRQRRVLARQVEESRRLFSTLSQLAFRGEL
jgi:type I restriction enzyme, S subunit